MTTPILLRPLLASFLLLTAAARAALPAPDADDGGISLPPGFRAVVVADNLVIDQTSGKNTDRLRFLAVAPNGDIYAKLHHGKILALRDTDGDGRADVIKEFGPGDGGTHIMFHHGYLYHSSRTAVYRYKYIPGELVPSSPLEVIVHDLPAEKDHDAKAFAFDDSGHLIVEVGSPYNVYSKPDRQFGAKGYSDEEVAKFQQTYGGFWSFDPDKPNQTQADGVRYSTGHRHSLALVWQPASKNFFMTMMGRDNLNIVDPEHYDALDNAERDAEEFHLLKPGVNLGWPYTYWDPIKQVRMRAPEYGGDNHRRDDNPAFDRPLLAFPAHWAPLQMCLYDGTQFPEKYRGGMFLAFHGSWNRAPRAQAGYKVVFIPFGADGLPTGDTAHGAGNYQDFATGFPGVDYFVNTRDARYRPSGVTTGPDGSLYISETERGRIWRVIYTGETMPAATRPPAPATAPAAKPLVGLETPGGKTFAQICAACHMPDGRGVAGMQPSLAGSAVVAGDPARLINALLQGPAAVLSPEREKFPVVMPPYGMAMSDADVAAVINFLRRNFAANASSVTAEQVAALRPKP